LLVGRMRTKLAAIYHAATACGPSITSTTTGAEVM
jgi:hypothetical protein